VVTIGPMAQATLHLLKKVDCLFACLPCWDLPNYIAPIMLLVTLKSPRWEWVHWSGFVMFRPMMLGYWKMNIFVIKNSIKSKLRTLGKLGQAFKLLVLHECDFLEVIL
jgi:hypothetical protein